MDIKTKIFISLFFVSILVIHLYIYHRWSKRNAERRIHSIVQNSRRDHHHDNSQLVFSAPAPLAPLALCNQLDRSILASLPVLDYAADNIGSMLQECAVCLSDFEVGERIRLLPKCNHSFHVDCIDMWFSSHSTCPICRSDVERYDSELRVTWRMPFLGMGARSTVFAPSEGEGTSHDSAGLDLEHG